MELQTLGDKKLRELTFAHVVKSIKRMNQKHKDEAKNRALQNILFVMLQVCQCFYVVRLFIELCFVFFWFKLVFKDFVLCVFVFFLDVKF